MKFQEPEEMHPQEEEEYQRSTLEEIAFVIWIIAQILFEIIALLAILSQKIGLREILLLLLPLAVLTGVERWLDSVVANPLKPSRVYWMLGQILWLTAAVILVLLIIGIFFFRPDIYSVVFYFILIIANFIIGRRYI